MFIIHIQAGKGTFGVLPGCIPSLLLEGDAWEATAHIIVNTNDLTSFKDVFGQILQNNPEIGEQYEDGIITITHSLSPKSEVSNLVLANGYDKVYYLPHPKPIDQKVISL